MEVDRTESAPRHFFISVEKGEARLDVVQLPNGGHVTVGRAPSNRIVLDDSKCSRQHCELFLRGGQWYLRDLESRNGVFVDGQRVAGDFPLVPGNSIQIGGHLLRLSDTHPDGERTASDSGQFAIIERKTGTKYDAVPSVLQRHDGQEGAADLFRLARLMASAASEQELCQLVLDALVSRSGATVAGVLLVPTGKASSLESLEVCSSYTEAGSPRFSSSLSRIVLNEGHGVLAHDLRGNHALAGQDSIQAQGLQSVICVPIRHQERVLGLIHLYSRQQRRPVTQDDLEFGLAVADQMGDLLQALRDRAQLALGLDRVRSQVAELQDQLGVESELVGQSPTLDQVRRIIQRVAPTEATVLIRGESGVGKELVARAVHLNSGRKDGPFICVNCAALTESLLESELFGHEKGAFTGAAVQRAGKFEQADGGTLFLDEIGEMSPEIQAKFLRVLEGQAFERVGGGKAIQTDVRVVTATNRDLEQAVREGAFRRDLFFRLNVIEITVPPLRQHPEDIPAIAQHFVERFSKRSHRRIRGLSLPALRKLQQHDWPGNVRELRNVVERAVILSENELLTPEDIVLTHLNLDPVGPEPGSSGAEPGEGGQIDTRVDPLRDLFGSFIQQQLSLDDMDRLYIQAVLDTFEWNKSKAARLLKIERTTLDRRLKRYELGRPGDEGLEAETDTDIDQIE